MSGLFETISLPGHVAPDLEKKKSHFNTLTVAHRYRIALRMGDIESLFAVVPPSKREMARYQVLGLFYFPLNHPGADDAFEECREWVREHIFPAGTEDKIVQDALRCRIADPAGVSFRDLKPEKGGLPPAAEDPTKPSEENFAKIRVPGGYSYRTYVPGRCLNGTRGYEGEFGKRTYFEEEAFYRDNPVLGKIPLVVKVEQWDDRQKDWMAPDRPVKVCFDLLPPYDLPPFREGSRCIEQYNRPPLRQARVVDQEERRAFDPSDPQATNCHRDLGGKRGNTVCGVDDSKHLFLTWPEGVQSARLINLPVFYKNARSPSDPSCWHAVEVKTDADGEARVLFMPSRMGGDRYRLAAFVPPGELGGEATEALRIETGTMVVWRNIRISQYLRHEVERERISKAYVAALGMKNPDELLQGAGLLKGKAELEALDLGAPPGSKGEGMVLQFARAFCEVELDKGAEKPQRITNGQWKEAIQKATEDAEFGRPDLGIPYRIDFRKLLCWDLVRPTEKVDGAITVETSVGDVPIRQVLQYNQTVASESWIPVDTIPISGSEPISCINTKVKEQLETLFVSYLLPGFMRSLTKNGVLPGLTIVQGWAGCANQVVEKMMLPAFDKVAGVSTHYRGIFVWAGGEATATASHELGHCLFLEHAPEARGAKPEEHDPPGEGACLMSDGKGRLGFCGKCLLALRGWRI